MGSQPEPFLVLPSLGWGWSRLAPGAGLQKGQGLLGTEWGRAVHAGVPRGAATRAGFAEEARGGAEGERGPEPLPPCLP
jgi:hypothetical protein